MNPAWFDETFYLAAKTAQLNQAGGAYTAATLRKALTDADMTPFEHYLAHGDAEGLSPSGFINRHEYLSAKANQLNSTQYQGKTTWDAAALAEEFAKTGVTAGQHYAAYGWKENINPSNDFDTSSYLAAKLASVRAMRGADAEGKPYSTYETPDLAAAFVAAELDPLSHYLLYGRSENLPASPVPLSERVPVDPGKPSNPVLAADGKTLTVHLQSPVKSASIEAEDFTVVVNGKEYAVAKAAAGADKVNYDVILTLDDANRLPGLYSGETSDVHVVYNPDGGSKTRLECDSGPVPAFDSLADNQSRCFEVSESTTTKDVQGIVIRTLNVSLTPPADYVESTDAANFVKVDLSSKTGVVTGGTYGIVTSPRLMDGALVNNLDASGVDSRVHLDIRARADGGEIVTGDGADTITLGAGNDVVRFTSMTNSQLGHLDTISGFTYETPVEEPEPEPDVTEPGTTVNVRAAADGATADKLTFSTDRIDTVLFKGPLSLEGRLDEKAIQVIFGSEKMDAKAAYLLVDGKDYLLVADSNGNGVFEAANDFAVSLLGITGLPEDLASGMDLSAMLAAA